MFTLCVCVILLLVHVMWLFGQENATVAIQPWIKHLGHENKGNDN